MTAPSTDEFVGAHVTVTLSSDAVITGTIFTYDAPNCALVLLQQPNADRPTVKIINTCFIKSMVVHSKNPKDEANRLPIGVAPGATLPGLGSENLQKKVNKTLAKAEERRQYPEWDVPIAACQLFDKLTLVCGQASFSQAPEHLKAAADILAKRNIAPGPIEFVIVVGDHVIVTDNGGQNASWEAPICAADTDAHDSLVRRVESAAAAAFK